ncbi:hypothetical protein GCM10027413_01070 [Conyzicola nivalis]|uniref:Uncharacterized protein n=1 Tax=Conyzicola nivalis TaxID=1477021 RepID=A0A916WKE8_9MICO|nr:hypothetical protein [Conyzicola nivalis]GGB09834.1 hypothetical protein GCM10010979_25570 [Conyzicola nivalis]
MSDIYVDRTNMERLMTLQEEDADSNYTGLGAMPAAVDAGAATALIAFLATGAAEAAGIMADTHRVLAAITTAVVEDVTLTEEQIQEDLGLIGKGLDD